MDGLTFWNTAPEQFEAHCYIVIMEGYMSHCTRTPDDVANSNGNLVFFIFFNC